MSANRMSDCPKCETEESLAEYGETTVLDGKFCISFGAECRECGYRINAFLPDTPLDVSGTETVLELKL